MRKILLTVLLVAVFPAAYASFLGDVGKAATTADSVLNAGSQSQQTTVADGALLQQLTQELGVSQQQALGGMGAVFKQAQTTLSPQEFTQLSDHVPNMPQYLSAVPDTQSSKTSSGVAGALGVAGGLLGGKAGATANSLSASALVASQFKQLGISPDLIGPFINIASNYLKGQGGPSTANLLQTGVAALL